MKKTETMNVLVESNKLLREEKDRLQMELEQAHSKVWWNVCVWLK